VDGKLPDLGDKGVAWRVVTPDLDRETVSRWAAALGLPGTPQQRDGAWMVETPEANFAAYPGDGWSISFNRNPGDRSPGVVSAAGAERQARALLDRLGVLEGEWRVQVYETEIGFGYACAEAVKMKEEMARVGPDTAVSSDSAPMSSTPSMPSMPDCPPPPPPVKGQNVSFFPVLGGMRTEWSGWNVTVGPDGIENLYGTWATFEKGDEYKLRSVDAALEELRQGGRAVPMPAPMPMPPDDATPAEPATDPAIESFDADSSGGGTSGSAGFASGSAGVATPTTVAEDYAEPAMGMPAPATGIAVARPAIAPYPYPSPCPPEADCVAPEPQVVTITGVELTLLPNPVYSGRTAPARMYLVPAYRFTGTFQGGEAWETTVIALHPDAIAPPPMEDGPPPVKGTESTTLPMPAPPYSTVMTSAPERPPAR
jgi:hypothetical protein